MNNPGWASEIWLFPFLGPAAWEDFPIGANFSKTIPIFARGILSRFVCILQRHARPPQAADRRSV
jgi:hypothetical protein